MSPILAIIVILLIGVIVWKSTRQNAKTNYPPGPPRLPLIGSYLHLLWIDYNRPYLAMDKLKERYKSPLIGFALGEFNCVVACDLETTKAVFNRPEFQGRMDVYPGNLRTYGEKNGIFGDDGDNWLHFRRNTLSTLRDFGFGRRSDAFEGVIEEEAKFLVERLTNLNGKPAVLPDMIYPTMFNLILSIVHGIRFPPEEYEKGKELGKVALNIITTTDSTGRLLGIWPWIRYLFPVLSGKKAILDASTNFKKFVGESYKRHKSDFDEHVIRDLMDYFIKNKENYPYWTEEQFLTACEDLMFPNAAASASVSFTLALLCENPEKLRLCQKQIDDVVGRGRLPTLNDRQHLTLVEGSVRESLRLYSIAPLGIPHRCTEDTTLNGYDIPKDTAIFTNFYSLQNDPALWGDPKNFRPERYSESKDFSLPFGLGKRVCAGETFARQNLFMVVATILQNFDMEIATPLDENKFRNGIVMAPNKDFSIRFTPRS